MIALTVALLIQSGVAAQPPGPQSVEDLQAISEYIAAISMKASLIKSCESFVDPGAFEKLRADLTNLPEVAHVKGQFSQLADAMLTNSIAASSPISGPVTEVICADYIDRTDERLRDLLPRFRATLPLLVGFPPPTTPH